MSGSLTGEGPYIKCPNLLIRCSVGPFKSIRKIRINLCMIIRIYLRALRVELCISRIYLKIAMKESPLPILIVVLVITSLVTLTAVLNTQAASRLIVRGIQATVSISPEELNSLTDTIFGAIVPGRGPSIPNISGGVPGATHMPGGGPSIPNIPGGVPGATHMPGGGPSIPNIPGGVFGIPKIVGGPPDIPGIPRNIFGP